MDTAPPPSPYREGLPPQPPGPPEGERHPMVGRETGPIGLAAGAGLLLGMMTIAALAILGVPVSVVAFTGLALSVGGGIAVALGRQIGGIAAVRRYARERDREEAETRDWPAREKWEVAAVLHRYGLRGDTLERATEAIAADRARWVDFMMRFELELSEPLPVRAASIGAAFAAGGALALLPLAAGGSGVAWSAALVALALATLGAVAARRFGEAPLRGGLGTLGVAAAAITVACMVALALR